MASLRDTIFLGPPVKLDDVVSYPGGDPNFDESTGKYRRPLQPPFVRTISGEAPQLAPLTARETPGGLVISHAPVTQAPALSIGGFQLTGTQLLIGAVVAYFLFKGK